MVKMESPHCNLCSGENFQVFIKDATSWEHTGVFTIVRCKNCDLTCVNPRPIQSEIGRYYPPESYWGDDVTKIDTGTDLDLRKRSYGYLYKNILSLKKKGSILDIGAGTGMFLSFFKEKGFVTDGVEYSFEACEYARKMFQVKLRTGDFLQKKFPKNTFDIVTMNNSLEHLHEPLNTLVGVHKTMKKGGVIVITVPNIDSLGSKAFKGEWYALQPPRHLYHFSEKTLTSMLKKSGFKVKDTKYGYFKHNYNTIFESIRLMKSPRFKKAEKGGVKESGKHIAFSLKKEVFKRVAMAVAFTLAIVGQVTQRSEVITVIAYK